MDVADPVGSGAVTAPFLFVVVSAVVAFAVASVASSVLWIKVFYPFPVTWVHPSSGWFEWSPGSRAGFVVGSVGFFSGLLLLMLPLL